MFNEPPGTSATSYSIVSNLFDAESERALACLRKQARVLRTASFRLAKLALAAGPGVLPPPRLVFSLDDGRALAWFGEGRPYVIHPSIADLISMHTAQHQHRKLLVHAA